MELMPIQPEDLRPSLGRYGKAISLIAEHLKDDLQPRIAVRLPPWQEISYLIENYVFFSIKIGAWIPCRLIDLRTSRYGFVTDKARAIVNFLVITGMMKRMHKQGLPDLEQEYMVTDKFFEKVREVSS